MSWIELKQMIFYAFHGVNAQERKVGNTYTVDLKFEWDIRKAAETDLLADTINYATVYALVREEMAIPSHLIEHVAGRIIRRLRQDFPGIETIELRLAKQNPPFGGDIREAAVVIISRKKI
ncbi:MAG: dihydroneopterin aldolase [Dysgonamonadaceae bacterium]|jgi:dihydroneopterin aldolase|nr:dihydroneopterin aldolase [Dysgonamonadaceae bacterium]